jgi:hypothetical protein
MSAIPTKPAISRRLILRKAGRALGEGKKVTVLLQKGWVPVSIAFTSETATWIQKQKWFKVPAGTSRKL